MKKLLILLMALIFVVGFYAISDAVITGSAHDFSTASWNSAAEKCNVCHIPHNATYATNGPLWNHMITSATFTYYTSPTGTIDASDIGQPNGVSKLCLSCHDGTVALDSFGGSTGSTTMNSTSAANFGTDLSDDHPISFTYDGTLATNDGELATPSSGKVAGTLPLFGGSNDQLECGTCHDPHDGGAGSRMLILSNAGSALCLTCHLK